MRVFTKSELRPIRDLRMLDPSERSLRWPVVLQTYTKPRHRLSPVVFFLYVYKYQVQKLRSLGSEFKCLHRLVRIVELNKTFSSRNINSKIQNIYGIYIGLTRKYKKLYSWLSAKIHIPFGLYISKSVYREKQVPVYFQWGVCC